VFNGKVAQSGSSVKRIEVTLYKAGQFNRSKRINVSIIEQIDFVIEIRVIFGANRSWINPRSSDVTSSISIVSGLYVRL
jgi:hypothetical protein